MPRPKKLAHGTPRTVLVRDDQLKQLDRAALAAGLDFSDVIRVAVDWLTAGPDAAPRSERAFPAGTRAGFELAWRALARTPHLARAALDGMAGRPMLVPADRPARPADLRLVRRAVALAAALQLRPPDGVEVGEFRVGDWADGAPGELLTVLAHPAVRVVAAAPGGRPVAFRAAPAIAPRPDGRPARLPERTYAAPAEALAALVKAGRVEAEDDGPTGEPGRRYRIVWA